MNRDQDERYLKAAGAHGATLARLARVAEADPERRRDLLQEMHVALWRSLAGFDGRCALNTWVYRVGHNVAGTHMAREKRARASLTLEEIEAQAAAVDALEQLDEADALERLYRVIRQLESPEREIILLYLEGADTREIAEVTGLQPAAISTRVHRFKSALTRMFSGNHHV